MCYPLTPRAEHSSKDGFNLLIINEERFEVENGFSNLPLEIVELAHPKEFIKEQQQLELENIEYGIFNALASFITALAQFDELNLHFFVDTKSVTILPFISQEL